MIVVIGSKGYLGSKVIKILKKTFVNVIEYEKIIKFQKLIYPTYVIYLKKPRKPRFTKILTHRSVALILYFCCFFNPKPIKKSTIVLKSKRPKNLQSHQP